MSRFMEILYVSSNTGLRVADTAGGQYLTLKPGSNLSADRVLTITTGDADRTLTLAGDATISGTSSGTNTGDQTLSSLGGTTVGQALFTLANPSAITFLRVNADNSVSALSDSAFRTALGLGSIATQAASGVAITGGTVNGAVIGGVTPAAGSFTAMSASALVLWDTGGDHGLVVEVGENFNGARTLTLVLNNASRTLTVAGDATVSGVNSGDQTVTLTGDVTGSGTGSFAATIGSDKVTTAKILDANVTAAKLGPLNAFTDADPALADVLPGYSAAAGANRDFLASRLLGLARLSPGGRLTLTSGTPVTTTDVTGATTLYYTPYLHDAACLWDGTRWVWGVFAETSLAVGTVTSGLPYDVFAYLNSGTFTLEKLAWTNGTTRATAVTIQDGRYCKSGDKTRLYLGTFYSTSTTATEDSAAKRFVWNAYNRAPRALRIRETADSWTYTTATWRSYNNSTANRVELVLGLAGDAVKCSAFGFVNRTVAGAAAVGVGLDSTSANSAYTYGGICNTGDYGNLLALYADTPAAGHHYLQMLEIADATGTATWYGDAGVTTLQAGMTGEVWA